MKIVYYEKKVLWRWKGKAVSFVANCNWRFHYYFGKKKLEIEKELDKNSKLEKDMLDWLDSRNIFQEGCEKYFEMKIIAVIFSQFLK